MTSFSLFALLPIDVFAERMRREGAVTVFHHIPKTAGSSLVQELRTCFPPYCNVSALQHRSEAGQQADVLMNAVETFLGDHAKVGYRSASGHFRLPHLNRMRENLPHSNVFTFLRDPVARMVSEFRYTRTPKQPTYLSYIERYPTIEDFIDSPQEQNRMWQFIAPRGLLPDAEGLEKIFRRYAFIGLVEDLKLCFEFYTGLTGHPKTPATRTNVTEARSDNDVALTKELVAKIRTANADDIALYEAVQARIEPRRAEMQAYIDARRALYAGNAAE